MTSTTPNTSFATQAELYFSRTSISNPVFIGNDRVAYLDNSSGTKQLGILDIPSGEMTAVTAYGEGLLSLLGSAASGRVVFGMDLGGNERQQLSTIAHPGEQPTRLTTNDTAFYEPGVLSTAGDAVIYRSNERDEGTFDIMVTWLESGANETWLEDGGQVTAVALDGDRALVIRNNGNMDSDLLLVEREGAVRNLTDHDGEQWIFHAAFSHDGEGVWLLSNLEREFVALMYLDLATGEQRVVHEADWDVELFAVSPDGSSIALSVNENGASRASIISTANPRDAVRDRDADGRDRRLELVA